MTIGVRGIGKPHRRFGFFRRFFKNIRIYFALAIIGAQDIRFRCQGFCQRHTMDGMIRTGPGTMGRKKEKRLFPDPAKI